MQDNTTKSYTKMEAIVDENEMNRGNSLDHKNETPTAEADMSAECTVKACDAGKQNLDRQPNDGDGCLHSKDSNSLKDTVDVDGVQEQNGIADEHTSVTAKKQIEHFNRQKRIRHIVSKAISIVAWIFGICVLYLCLSNLYQQLFNPSGYTGFFGIGEAVVSSNSMEPKLYTNDLIFYKAAEISEIDVGDTIIYQKNDSNGNVMLVVHEVVDIGGGYVTTQGINNSVEDESFPISMIVGKYMFKISQIGVLLNVLSTKWAPPTIVFAVFAIMAMRILIYYIQKKRLIEHISIDASNRDAIDYFFDL